MFDVIWDFGGNERGSHLKNGNSRSTFLFGCVRHTAEYQLMHTLAKVCGVFFFLNQIHTEKVKETLVDFFFF